MSRLAAYGMAIGVAFIAIPQSMASPTQHLSTIEVSHYVKPGETLGGIANMFNVDLKTLERINGLHNVRALRENQIIYIPKTTKQIVSVKPVVRSYKSVEAIKPHLTNKITPNPVSIIPDIATPSQLPETIEKTAQLSDATKAALTTRYNPTDRDISLVVPLKDRQFYLGDVTLKIDTEDNLFILLEDFKRVSENRISNDDINQLSRAVDEGGYVTIDAIKQTGLGISYDPGLLELSLTVPSTMRTSQSFSIANLDREALGNFVEPEAFSFYSTMRGSLDYIHEGGVTGVGDPFIDFQIGGRLMNIAYETEAFYDGFNGDFNRRGSRLIYDDVDRAIRYQAGDVRSAIRGFQSPADVLGLSIGRAYSTLQPLRSIRPRGERSFVLDEPGFVEVQINGRPVRRLRLDAGTFDLADFPFVSGSNDVRVVVENQAGRSEELAFNLFFDQSMLQTGTSEFAATFGIAAPLSGGEPDYNFDEAIFSGFYRRGFSSNLTAGANLQATDSSGLIGLEAIWSNAIGTFRPQLGLSTNDFATDFSTRLDFERQLTGDVDQDGFVQDRSRFVASLTYTGERFSRFGNFEQINPFSLETAASYNWDITPSMNASVGANYNMGRNQQSDVYGGEVRLGWRLSALTGINLTARYDKSNSFDGLGVFVSLSRRFGQRNSFRAGYDTRSDRAVLSYSRASDRYRGDWGANIDVEYANSDSAVNADFNYIANVADLGVAHRASLDDGGSILDQRTSLRAATTLGFAGGSFAFGRPGSGNFAIVKPHKTLKGKRIRLNPFDEKEHSRSAFGLPPLTADINSYSKTSLQYDIDDLPLGYDLGAGNFDLLAPLHAGYKLVVGSDYSISVIGTLLNDFEEPLAYLTGTATRADGQDADKTLRIFTNGAGRFGEAFAPGKWRLTMRTTPETIYEFTIPEENGGIFRAGTLQPIGEE